MELMWNAEGGDRVMAMTRRARAYDPEFDPPGGLSLGRPVFDMPHHYQRLVANPFLALLSIVANLALLQAVTARGAPDSSWLPWLALATCTVLLFVWQLPQYHCLDCGATDQLRNWREHECEAVKLRRAMGRPRRLRGPTPNVQTVLWFYAAIVCAIFVYIVWR
jgi:hypothetical protein